MNRWTNVRHESSTSGQSPVRERPRKNDYLAGPFPWTGEQAVACFEAHGWAGGDALVRGLSAAWEDPRPPCFPPHEAIDASTAIDVMLERWATVRGYLAPVIDGQLTIAE
jgi:hypothetical protein